MQLATRAIARLSPLALALALALVVPALASAQAAPAAAAPTVTGGDVKNLPLTSEERQRYTGSYTFAGPDGGRMVIRVFDDQGVLKGQPEGDESSVIFYQGEHTFRPEANLEMVVVFTVVNNRATKMTIARQGMTMEGVRNP